MADQTYQLFLGPWENSKDPATIIQYDQDGGDPILLATLKRVHHLGRLRDLIDAANTAAELKTEVARLNAIVNTPQADDFLRAVSTEAEHQRQRWPSEHDAGKTPADWFWLIGYLAGKALHAHAAGNLDKATHHVITTAAACSNWFRAMRGQTNMRPGIEETDIG